MKKAFFVLFFVFVVGSFAANSTRSAESVSAPAYIGGQGEFEYPWQDYGHGPEFVVWQSVAKGNKAGVMGGVIGPETVLTIKNIPGITRQNLSVLSGKQVVAIGKFRERGKGEGSYSTYSELILLVLENK